jgi:putative hydrolase of the HAD superfamily
VRKPDPRIYLHACEALGVQPPEAVFLDDIGRNLKAARELGMATIKVEEPGAALAELARVLRLEAGALA